MNFNNVKALHIPEGDVIRIQSGDTVLWEKYFEQTASGEIISLNNSIDGTISGLSLYGKSTQNGTPTPTAPIPITNIVNPTIGTTGKNLFDIGTVNDYLVLPVYNPNAVNFTISDNALSGITNLNGTHAVYNTKLKFKSGTYTFSSVNPVDLYRYVIRAYDASGNIVTASNLINDWRYNTYYQGYYKFGKTPTAIIPDSVASWNVGFVFMVKSGEAQTTSIYSDIQIELGSTATGYEPYKSGGSATINRTLCGIGSVKDELIVNKDGTGKFVQRIGHRTFDGSESWNLNAYFGSGDERWARCTLKDTTLPTDATNDDTDIRVISDKLRGVTADADVNNRPSSYAVSVISNQRFSVWLAPSLDGIDKFKAWFKENNTTVQYELATPIETDLTAEEVNAILSLKTFEPTTVVMNDKGAEMTVRYVGTH